MKVTVFSSPFDPALQAQQIDDAIAQKYDLFVVQIISQRAIIPVLTRVKNANIPVVLVVAPMVGNDAGAQDLYLANVGYDHATHSQLDHAVLLDFVNPSMGVGARVAVEMDLASGKALVAQLQAAIAEAEREGYTDQHV